MSHQQAVQDEAWYYFVIQDFKELVEVFGAEMILKDLAHFTPEAYSELISTALMQDTICP